MYPEPFNNCTTPEECKNVLLALNRAADREYQFNKWMLDRRIREEKRREEQSIGFMLRRLWKYIWVSNPFKNGSEV